MCGAPLWPANLLVVGQGSLGGLREFYTLRADIVRCGPHVASVAKVEVASARIFRETLNRDAIDDSHNLSRATEVAYEFCVGR
jgi:hypothetical protein